MDTNNLKKYLDQALEITRSEMFRRLGRIKNITGNLRKSIDAEHMRLYKRKESYVVYYRSPRGGEKKFPYAKYIDDPSKTRNAHFKFKVLPTYFLDPLRKDFMKLKKDIAKATKKDVVAMIKEYKKHFKNIK